jgi:uncharacterized protein YidB (DUF937 family)/outer membrane protein OmpA-like peptidoglycan-associated protein
MMFDALVQEIASRFDLGGKAGALVRAVLTYIFQEESGGLNAVLDRFRKAGLGDVVNSWIGSPAPRELTQGQLEGALGRSFLEQLADKAGLSASKATPALAALLPKLIGMLTADGKVPSTIPAGVSSWLGGAARTVGSYRAEPTPERVGTYRAEPVREPVAPARSMWTWLLPLLGLGALALVWALWPTSRDVPPPATTQAPPRQEPTTAAPAPATAPATAELWPMKIYFATGSNTLGAEDSARIQRAVDYLKANPAAVVDITGYADKSGAAATNEELAKERAKVVRDALVAAGIPESRTNLVPPVSVTAGSGSDDPEARRVEIRPKG